MGQVVELLKHRYESDFAAWIGWMVDRGVLDKAYVQSLRERTNNIA